MENKAKSGLEASLKSLDTEEFIDIHFYSLLATNGPCSSKNWESLPIG